MSGTAVRALAFSLVVGIGCVIFLRGLKVSLHGDLLWALMRASVQLAVLGVALKYVFSLPLTVGTSLSWLVMMGFATQVVVSRAENALRSRGLRVNRTYLIGLTFWLIALSFSALMGGLISVGALEMRPSALIPLGGMLLGSSVVALSLSYERLADELRSRGDVVEGLAGVGVSPTRLAMSIGPWVMRSVLVPRIDNLKAMGLVWIPGLMTGLVLAGLSPVEASAYQLMIMVAIFANSALLSAGAVALIGPRLIAENFF